MAKNSPYLDRPPRIQPELPTGTVEIPEPPREDNAPPPWQLAVPLVTILAYVLLSLGGGGTNIAFLLPMALTVIISTGIAVYNTLSAIQRRRRARADYLRRLIALRREMVASHQRQRAYYEYNYPPIEVTLDIRGERDNRGGSRLWERRPDDGDFGEVRIGIGTRPSTVAYTLGGEGDGASPLLRDAERLQSDSRYLDNAPITLPLYQPPEHKGAPVRHLIGITGAPADVYALVDAMMAHMVVFHSPIDFSLNVLGLREAAGQWVWAAGLPHAAAESGRAWSTRLYFEDVELITAPEDGWLTQINWNEKDKDKFFNASDVIATLQTRSGAPRDLRAPFPGRVSWALRLDADRAKNEVKAGQLIARIGMFRLTDQQQEEITRPDYDLPGKFGKNQRKRELAGIPRYWKEVIWNDLDQRTRRARDERGDPTLPFMLTVVDLLAAKPGTAADPLARSWLDDLESEQALASLTASGRDLGAAVIFLVPQRQKIPSVCQAVIELKHDDSGVLRFLYAETGDGAAAARLIGTADRLVERSRLIALADALAGWKVRRSYGADIPRSAALMKLYEADTIPMLNLVERWRESKLADKADWPKVPIGMLPGAEARELHFFADADGVHGMIAGATGSGKSELLMTLILSLAIKYDPSVVNFVLIDYKGGAAFEPFRTLPHVVDVVTNLKGNAVARMFAAIRAELDRRQLINQNTDMKDIVRYRSKGLHLRQQDNYPHLFIIIDEFAEMIANNAEYKAQLDSITRLGRALGVSLILAAQRPTGVTDQMRANIKMKLCLRVETKEESSEMLRMPDAAYLPSIAGRGYLQIGNESLQLIQVGYTGQQYPYDGSGKHDPSADPTYDELERFTDVPIIWERTLEGREPEKLYEVMVRRMKQLADSAYSDDKPRPWKRPWPRPLPERLTLNTPDGIEVEYIDPTEREDLLERATDAGSVSADDSANAFTFAPALNEWLSDQPERRRDWGRLKWSEHALRAAIGLIDDPSAAKLRILEINLRRGHHVLFGAAGYGKSVFLRSLITSMVVSHSPSALHIYIMDFGARALEIFEHLPHVGAYIVAHEQERIARLLRKLDQIVEERKVRLNEAKIDSLLEYNARVSTTDPDKVLPAVMVVIDNFAEFKENYEAYLDTLTGLLREGLSTGIYFVVTGEQTSAVGKLFNLIPERLTLRLSDEGEYAGIVGRGARMSEEVPGRGLRRVERAALEMQIAAPVGLTEDDAEDPADEVERNNAERQKLFRLVDRLRAVGDHLYSDKLPVKIVELPIRIDLQEALDDRARELDRLRPEDRPTDIEIVLGRDDFDLSAKVISLKARAHFVVSGSPASGRTTALQTMIIALADRVSPERAGIVLVDYQSGIAGYSSIDHTLAELPHVLENTTLSTEDELKLLKRHLEYEFSPEGRKLNPRELFVFIDNYEDMDKLSKNNLTLLSELADLTRLYGKAGLHFIIGASKGIMTRDDWVRQIGALKYGLALDTDSAESAPFHASVPRAYKQTALPRGRGFVIQPGSTNALQVAMPTLDEIRRPDLLDAKLTAIQAKWAGVRAEWLPLPAETEPNGAKKMTPEERECLAGKIAEKMGRWEDDAGRARIKDQLLNDNQDDMGLFVTAETRRIDIKECVPWYEDNGTGS